MPQTPEDIKRESEEIVRQRTETQNAQMEAQNVQGRTTLQSAIAALLAVLHTVAQQIAAFRLRSETVDARRENWTIKHPEFTKSGFSPSYIIATYLVLLLIYAAAYWLDVLLLSHNAKLLVKDFANGNQTLIYASILGLPLVVLQMETYFQTQWTAAKTTGQKWLWGSLSVVMCLAIPVTIVGFSMATSSAPAKDNDKVAIRTALVQNWQLIGKAVLAFFAHSAILLGGNRLHEAKSYLIYKVKDISLLWQNGRLSGQINRAETNLTNQFNDYYRQLNNFNSAHPQNRIEAGPFNQITREEINRVFGYEIIAAPLNQIPPPNNNEGGADNGSGEAIPYVLPPDQPLPENQDQNNQANNFGFDMDGEDEVRP